MSDLFNLLLVTEKHNGCGPLKDQVINSWEIQQGTVLSHHVHQNVCFCNWFLVAGQNLNDKETMTMMMMIMIMMMIIIIIIIISRNQ